MSASLILTLLAAGAIQLPDAVRRWREDVAVARRDFLPRDLSYTPAARRAAEQRLDRLHRDVPTLSDAEIVAELARVAALADNAHTRAYLLRNRGWWRRYPIRIWKFADGWRVIAARPGQEALLGARILRIGGRSVTHAEAAVRPLFAGPATWAGYMASYALSSPDALLGSRVIRGDGRTDFAVEANGRRSVVRLAPADEPRRTAPEESWWFLSPAHDAVKGWAHVLGQRPLPAYLTRPNRWYELRRCTGNILYLPFTRAEDQPGQPPIAAFGKAALEALAATPDARLVVDLRFNTGGNLQKAQPFFEQLAAAPVGRQPGRLFVVLGPNTFSAGITPAALLKARSRASFVGSPPGDHLRFWAEGGNVPLPNSGITLHYADRAHLYTPRGAPVAADLVYLRLNATTLAPDLPAAPTFADYLAGRDAAAARITRQPLSCEPM